MTLNDLNIKQKNVLKQHILTLENENVSYSDLANAENLISDEKLEKEFGGTEFVEEDFF